MDLFNNEVGISYCWNCFSTSSSSIANAIKTKLDNGELRYLKPLLSPKYNSLGQIVNPNGDPNFYGINGTNNPATATHGISANTLVTPTNQ